MMNKIKDDNIKFEEQCIVDEAKVFYYSGKVYRAIYNEEQVSLYSKLFTDSKINNLTEKGLVHTTVVNDIQIEKSRMILEHEKINFFLDPCEMTDKMFWEAALCMVGISKELAISGMILKDAHPWNLTFHKGKPVFFDFSSIAKAEQYGRHWLEEFYTYFAVPIYLASSKWAALATEYRRQHLNGFGLKLSEFPMVRKMFFRSFFALNKYLNTPTVFLDKLEKWLMKHKPASQTGTWDAYEQGHSADYSNPVTIKQRFVHDILVQHKPKLVADLATNKGYYAFMAQSLGASVVGFDYESPSVDIANNLIAGKDITFCQMNFLTPTNPHGWGLVIPDAFHRFRSDIAIALGLIHHVCLVQRFPVKLFCASCSKYAVKGVILEFVYPEDTHVAKWNANIPDDYNIDSIRQYFLKNFSKYEESEMFTDNDTRRRFLFFYN